MNPVGNRTAPDAVESKPMKGFHMKRALFDLAQDVASFFAMAAFLAFVVYGSAGLSAVIIAWRAGQ